MARRQKKIRAGMNVDSRSVRLVLVNREGEIVFYAQEELPELAIIRGHIRDVSVVAEKIGKLLRRAKLRSRQVDLTWAPDRFLYKTMPLPTGAGKNMQSALMIDAQSQMSPIDPSLLQLHVFQRPEEGAAVYAYDRAALTALLETAHLARLKIRSLSHPVAGLMQFAQGALCYLGEGSSYYTEGAQTPSYLRSLDYSADDADGGSEALYRDGASVHTDWVDALAQDILLTRHQVRRELGKTEQAVYFAGPALAVPGMGKYLKGGLASIRLATLKMPYAWPEGVDAGEQTLYAGALAALSAPEESNILKQADIRVNDEEIVDGGIRVQAEKGSYRWLIGVAAAALGMIVLTFASSMLLDSMSARQIDSTQDYRERTRQLAESGEVKIIGSEEWVGTEERLRGVWESNAAVRTQSQRVQTLAQGMRERDLNPTELSFNNETVSVRYAGDRENFDNFAVENGWEIVSSEDGAAEIK
jgi:hypothetical protein